MKFYSHFDDWGGATMTALLLRDGMTEVRMPGDADLIVFNGGADIGTSIYNETPVWRGVPHGKSHRDLEEIALYEDFKKDKTKFFLGICRGAQLLNCLNGGTLWQHVDKHTQDHTMVDVKTGTQYYTTSTHHQMMRPNLELGEIIAVASESHNKYSDHNTINGIQINKNHIGDDVEIVWYPENRTLCVQGHPEYIPGSRFAKYVLDMTKAYMKETVVACAA